MRGPKRLPGRGHRELRNGPAFHVALGIRDRGKAKLPVETMGVLGHELKAAEILQTWMGVDKPQNGFGEPSSAVVFEDVNVAEVGERGVVADDPGEPDLVAGWRVDADAK